MRHRKFFFVLWAALLLSCGRPAPDGTVPPGGKLPASLTVSGAGIEDGTAPRAMVPVSEGVWDIYAEFTAGGKVRVFTQAGAEWASFEVAPGKAGICRLRVDAKANQWSLVKINKVSLVVTEGGVDNPAAGNKPPIEATYAGGGVWLAEKLYVATDHIRYRYLLETDTPSELKYWCATWDNAGSVPTELTDAYLTVRALGQTEYDALFLKDNRACWMFPAEQTQKLANISISMNAAVPVQVVSFGSAHRGPKAVFIGDSITWQWGTNPREIAKTSIVIPLDPLPSFLQDRGNNVLVTWHPQFFTSNNYVDKGISAENTTQMVDRYQKDVLNQDPHCVVIMGGTNDLAQGYSKDQILSNLSSMAEQAEALGMKVILCSVTPCNDTYSRLNNPKTKGAHILALNEMIRSYAESKGFVYCDYYPALVAADGLALKEEYCLYDRLHPNPDAYTVMEGIIKPIIDKVLK